MEVVHIDNGIKSIKLSTATIIVLMVAALGLLITSIGRNTANKATEGLTITRAEAEGLFANYNGTIVSGTEVQRAIKDEGDLCLVKTNKKPAGIDLSKATDKNSNDYVNPTARFSANLDYNEEDTLQNIVFSQINSDLVKDIRDPSLSESETTPSTETDAPDVTNPYRELVVEMDHDLVIHERSPEPDWKSLGMTVYALRRNGAKEEVTGYSTNYSSSWSIDDDAPTKKVRMTITYDGLVKNNVEVTLAKSLTEFVTVSTTNTIAGHPITVDASGVTLDYTVTGMDCAKTSGEGESFTTQTNNNESGTVRIVASWEDLGEEIEFNVAIDKFSLSFRNETSPSSSGILIGDQIIFQTNATATFSDVSPYLSDGPSIEPPATGSAISKIGSEPGTVTMTATDAVSGFVVSTTVVVYGNVALDSPVTVKAGETYEFTSGLAINFVDQEFVEINVADDTYQVTPTKVGVYDITGTLPDLGGREVSFQLIATNPDWEYTVEGDKATLTKYIGGQSSVTIPARIEDPYVSGGYPVVAAIGTFKNNGTLVSVQFEPGVETLRYTFYGCQNLQNIGDLPNTVTSMYGTFQKCTKATEFPDIPGGVTEIRNVFSECTSMVTTPHLGDQITNMISAFAGNTSLKTITNIPAKVVDFAEAFSRCTSLTGTVPLIPSTVANMAGSFYHCEDAVIYIDNYAANVYHDFAFDGIEHDVEHHWLCDEWEWQYNGDNIDLIKYNGSDSYVKVPSTFKGRTVVGLQGAFQGNGRITGVVIPATVTNLDNTFNGCTGLVTAPEIPYGVTSMQSTFENCTNLQTASEIPGTVKYMFRCFRYCRSLQAAPKINNGVQSMCGTFESCSSLRVGTAIPDSVTDASWAYVNCSSLAEAPEVGSGVTNMESTFQGCVAMTEPPVIKSTKVTTLYACFKDCYALSTPPNIINISSLTNMTHAFEYCKAMSTMPELPGAVQTLDYCFNGCTALDWESSVPNSVISMSYAFQDCTSLYNPPKIGSSVTNMAYAFSGCTALSKCSNVPESVTNLSYTFANCRNITETYDVKNQSVNWNYTFSDCTNLTTIKSFPSGGWVMEGAFSNCHRLAGLPTVPSSYGDIDSAFTNCSSAVVYVDNTAGNVSHNYTFNGVPEYHFLRDEWDYSLNNGIGGATLTNYKGSSPTPVIPKDIGGQIVTALDNTFKDKSGITGAHLDNGHIVRMSSTFENCDGLATAPAIPSTVREMVCTFRNCDGLVTASTIPNGVTTMERCYQNCTRLVESPAIPGSVNNLFYAFYGCTNLTRCGTINNGPTNLQGMFADCKNLTVGADMPSTAQNLKSVYNGCTKLATMIDTKDAATSMDFMYYGCQNMTSTCKTGGRNVSKSVKSMISTFQNCYKLRGTIYIAKWLDSYNKCFRNCATDSNALVLVNYSAENASQIDAIIATKASNSKVKKYKQK